MADVFISYKTEDFDEANWVKSTLENNGISCWMAPTCIPGGSSYAVEIPQAIRTAKVFVLILSERCQTSKWVPRELDQAINDGKTVLPFMLENCSLKDEFNFYLSNVQRYYAYENKSSAIKNMINQIRAIIDVDTHGDNKAEKNTDGLKDKKDVSAKTQTCPKCGADLEENARFCYHCMTSLDEKSEISGYKKTVPKKVRIAIISVSMVIVVLLFSVGGIIIRKNTKDKKQETAVSSEETAVEKICAPEDFIVRALLVDKKLGTEDLWNVSSLRDIRKSAYGDMVEYTADLKIDDSLLSLYFFNEGEEIVSVLWDVAPENEKDAKNLLICFADAACNYYFTDIGDVFFNDKLYPRSALSTPFEKQFTDPVKRTENYNEMLAQNSDSISTEYIGMSDGDFYLVLYTTKKNTPEGILYDFSLYIGRPKA